MKAVERHYLYPQRPPMKINKIMTRFSHRWDDAMNRIMASVEFKQVAARHEIAEQANRFRRER